MEENKNEVLEENKNEENEKNELVNNQENLDNQEEKPEEESLTPKPIESIVELTTEYDYRAQKYCQMYRLRVKNKSIIVNSIFSVILLGLAIYMFIVNEGQGKFIAIFPLVFFLYTLYGIFFEEKKVDNYLKKFFQTHAKFALHYQINDDVVRFTQEVNGEERWADFPWAYITEVHQVPEYYFLFLNGGNILIIDRREECMEKGTQADLALLIKKQCELKPFVKYDKKYFNKLIDVQYYQAPINDSPEEETNEDKKDE